ncbi:MFS transporter [Oceanobacillus oncorhynchi]|uniref:MFS transporter n=1 Tax=Oceanobacillus oncorhynchi TaxID=545501 RepID=UPI001865D053|nr:MFS transporter [Oceanobacillus oncorhynchi]
MKYTRRETISLISICIGSFLIILDTNIVNIIIPPLREQLYLSNLQTSWVVNSYVLVFASFILFFARFGKRIGARNAFITGISIFMVGSLFCGFSNTYEQLVISRIIQGVGAAMFAPIATKLLSSTVTEPKKRATAFGIWSGTSGIAFAFSPMVGGFLNELWGWQSTFLINIPFSLIVIWTGLAAIKDTEKEKIPMFFKEQVLVALFILIFVFMIQEYKVIYQLPLLFTLGGITLLIFGYAYSIKFRNNQTQVIERQLFTKQNVASLINGFTYNFSIYGVMYFLSIHFQEHLFLSSLETGVKFLPLTVSGMLISSFLSPVLVNKLGQKWTQQLCLLAIIAGSIFLFTYFTIAAYSVFILISFILFGFSGAIAPVLMNAAFLSTGEKYHNEISSLVNLARQIGSIFGVISVSIILDILANTTTILYFLVVIIFISFFAFLYLAFAYKLNNQKSGMHE